MSSATGSGRKLTSRRDFLQRAAFAGVSVAGVTLAAPAIAAGNRSFTFGYDEPHDTGYGFFADQFGAKLKELSDGRFTIRQFPGAQLGQEPEMAQKVRTGDIDFVINSTANTSTVVPQSGVFSLHFIFRDEAHLSATVLDPGVNQAFQKMIQASTTGAHSLGLGTLGFRKCYSKFPIRSIADVKGRKVRVQATKTEDRFFSAYGCIPVHMPIGQVYTSLETGLVDIAENGADIYRAQKHYEVAPVLSATDHEANNNHLWVSDKVWNSLDAEEQGWVTTTFSFAQKAAVPKSFQFDHDAIDSLKKLGVEIVSEVDKKGFVDIATPIQDEQAKELGPYAVQLLEMTRKVTS
ncbi:MAG: TRAP transporter substrate-binding protein [Acidisphaera sp.]|nr:TRAP transporter substrate-binding protein [Acidisphaera sp.]